MLAARVGQIADRGIGAGVFGHLRDEARADLADQRADGCAIARGGLPSAAEGVQHIQAQIRLTDARTMHTTIDS